MDYKGRIIIEPKFDKVTINEPELARYIKKNRVFMINKSF